MGPLTPDTPLARFTASGDIRAEKQPRVRERFMQPRKEASGRWALSTFRIDGLNAAVVRVFGEKWVRTNLGPGRTLKAHCQLPVGVFEQHGLTCEFDDSPPRHVNVVDWPDETDAQLALAQDLCARIETDGHVERYG